MGKDNGRIDEKRVAKESKQALDEILREGARRMLQSAIEAEVAEYVEKHKEIVDEETGHRKVVRNGHQPERTIQSGLGDIPVKKPRVHDRREGKKFTSSILPPYMRKTPNIEALIPILYLKGVSTNDFPDALRAILGEKASFSVGRRYVDESPHVFIPGCHAAGIHYNMSICKNLWQGRRSPGWSEGG